MSRPIPGTLNMAALALLAGKPLTHDERAQVHRPTNPAALAAEIRRLAATGLTARDISIALRVGLGQVLEALQDAQRGTA